MRKYLSTAALLLLSACHASTGRAAELPGTTLSARGPVVGNVLGFSTGVVKVGGRYGFAFPELENDGKAVVTLQRVTITHVPQGVRVVAYSILDARQTHGQLLTSVIGAHAHDNEDYLHFHQHSIDNFQIAPHKPTLFYPVVIVKVVGPVHDDLTGCMVHYRTSGRLYFQAFDCDYAFTG